MTPIDLQRTRSAAASTCRRTWVRKLPTYDQEAGLVTAVNGWALPASAYLGEGPVTELAVEGAGPIVNALMDDHVAAAVAKKSAAH
jgi:hypothetical protein